MMNKRLVNGLMLKAFILASLSIIWVLNSDIQAKDVDKKLPLEGKTLVIVFWSSESSRKQVMLA